LLVVFALTVALLAGCGGSAPQHQTADKRLGEIQAKLIQQHEQALSHARHHR
jgi:outer membrane biogenesis lipoprotein LolB